MATPRVLVIEDNPDDALIMERALRPVATVEFADNGTEGIRLAGRQPFDVVVLDYRLNDLTGTEVMVKLRERNDDLPVIITSGMGSHFIVARTLALGAREFVSKDDPEFADKLIRAIQHVTGSQAEIISVGALSVGDPDKTRAQEIREMVKSLLNESDLVNTVGIMGADGALVHGRVKEKSGADDVTAVLAGTVQMMLSTVAGHLGYGKSRSIVASYEKGAIGVAPLPGNLALFFTSSALPSKVEDLRGELEAAAGEISLVLRAKRNPR